MDFDGLGPAGFFMENMLRQANSSIASSINRAMVTPMDR